MKVSRQDLSLKHFNTWKDESNDFLAGTQTPASFNLVLALAAKRVALGKSQTVACLDVSTAFLYAEMQVEVYIKMDADTLRLIREETCQTCNHSTIKVSTKWTKLLFGYRGSRRYWKDAVSEAAKGLGLKPSKTDNSLHLDPGNLIQHAHVDDELFSGDDQLVRDMEPKLQQKDVGEESGLSAPGWRHD